MANLKTVICYSPYFSITINWNIQHVQVNEQFGYHNAALFYP